MKLLEYEDKELKKKSRAVDVESLLSDIDDYEALNGAYSSEKVAEAYYAFKKDLFNALIVEIKEEKQ